MSYQANDFGPTPKIKLWKLVFWSGLIAGLSEIIWITLYCLATNTNGFHIAHRITETVFPSLPYSNHSLVLGILIHFTLSLLSSIAFIRTLWLPFTRHYHKSVTLIFGALLGMILWMLNFWVILPLINKSFVRSLPHAITLISELIFGVTLAWSISVFHKHKYAHFMFSRSEST
jgi:uncharacterized membrane protein YagU involved in acid resistance